MRDSISSAILEHRFKEAREALSARKQKLAEDIADQVTTKKERDIMAKIPKGWLAETDSIRANFNGCRYNFALSAPRPFPAIKFNSNFYSVGVTFSADSPIFHRWEAIEKESKQYSEEYSQRSKEIRAVLNSVTTLGKLFTVWPECEPIVKRLKFSAPVYPVPAVQLKTLNKALGLPPETK
jgi:hypothetical protein